MRIKMRHMDYAVAMRTTISIDDSLYRRVKEQAGRSGRTVSDLIEDAVRLAFLSSPERIVEIPDLPTFGSLGPLPGADLQDRGALEDLMDTDVERHALR